MAPALRKKQQMSESKPSENASLDVLDVPALANALVLANVFMDECFRRMRELTDLTERFNTQVREANHARAHQDATRAVDLYEQAVATYIDWAARWHPWQAWLEEQKARDSILAFLVSLLPPGFPPGIPWHGQLPQLPQ